MRRSGSLFLQHLRYEARIIKDVDGRLSAFLACCELEAPTSVELERCRRAIGFAHCLMLGDAANLWKADYLFCLIRDYLIKRLAAGGVVAFGIPDIYEKARRLWQLDEGDLQTLLHLRKLKAAYRQGVACSINILEIFDAAARLIHKIDFSTHAPGRPITIENLPCYRFESAYEQLRVFEAVYLLYRDAGYVHHDRDRIDKLIREPNMYGGATARRLTEVRALYQELLTSLIGRREGSDSTHASRYESFPCRLSGRR